MRAIPRVLEPSLTRGVGSFLAHSPPRWPFGPAPPASARSRAPAPDRTEAQSFIHQKPKSNFGETS